MKGCLASLCLVGKMNSTRRGAEERGAEVAMMGDKKNGKDLCFKPWKILLSKLLPLTTTFGELLKWVSSSKPCCLQESSAGLLWGWVTCSYCPYPAGKLVQTEMLPWIKPEQENGDETALCRR